MGCGVVAVCAGAGEVRVKDEREKSLGSVERGEETKRLTKLQTRLRWSVFLAGFLTQRHGSFSSFLFRRFPPPLYLATPGRI